MSGMDVRWSLKTHQRGWSFQDTLTLWKLAEESGFYAVYLNDHLYDSTLECWTMLAAMFSHTKTIRGGTLVTSNSFRHPTILAKMTTSVDHISNGRLIVGLGAGNEAQEYKTYGLDFPPPAERVRRLDESCQLLKAAWSSTPSNFSGKYYSLQDATFAPPPVQQPHPTLLLGVKGDLALRVAARHADEWNWNRAASSTEDFVHRSGRLDELCREIGRDPATLPRGLGHRRLMTQIEAGDVTLDGAIRETQDCIRNGATQVVLMLDVPARLREEIAFYLREFIPAVMAGV